MASVWDAIVVGMGVMGSAACAALARRGAAVLGIERFSLAHPWGSSHGATRLVRTAYSEHPDYVPLVLSAIRGWRELERIAHSDLLHQTGILLLAAPGSDLIDAARRAAAQHGLQIDLLDRQRLARDFPAFRVPSDHVAAFEPAAGFLFSERGVIAMARSALEAGARVQARERILAWSEGDGDVEVVTDRGRYRTRHLVFAAGAWSAPLLGDLLPPLIVTRQPVLWIWPAQTAAFLEGRFPCWARGRRDGGLDYGFPLLPSQPGLKVARHWPGDVMDPDDLDRVPRPDDERVPWAALEELLPDAAGSIVSVEICRYCVSPDRHFILDHGARQGSLLPRRVSVAAGFSGHGFKFAPVIGEVLADFALEEGSDHPVDFLSLQRFRSPAHVPGDA